jgi:hypothetical protein
MIGYLTLKNLIISEIDCGTVCLKSIGVSKDCLFSSLSINYIAGA